MTHSCWRVASRSHGTRTVLRRHRIRRSSRIRCMAGRPISCPNSPMMPLHYAKSLAERGADRLRGPVDLFAGDQEWRRDADVVDVSVFGKVAFALQALAVASGAAGFRVKLNRQHQPVPAHLADGVGADAL